MPNGKHHIPQKEKDGRGGYYPVDSSFEEIQFKLPIPEYRFTRHVLVDAKSIETEIKEAWELRIDRDKYWEKIYGNLKSHIDYSKLPGGSGDFIHRIIYGNGGSGGSSSGGRSGGSSGGSTDGKGGKYKPIEHEGELERLLIENYAKNHILNWIDLRKDEDISNAILDVLEELKILLELLGDEKFRLEIKPGKTISDERRKTYPNDESTNIAGLTVRSKPPVIYISSDFWGENYGGRFRYEYRTRYDDEALLHLKATIVHELGHLILYKKYDNNNNNIKKIIKLYCPKLSDILTKNFNELSDTEREKLANCLANLVLSDDEKFYDD